jgi:hypothetical protein
MADKKKQNSESNDTWTKMENPMSMLGKFAWLIALASALLTLASSIPALNWYNYYMALGPFGQATAATFIGTMVWNFVCMGVCIVIIVIYVFKFSAKCGAKDWDAVVEASVFNGKFPKVLLMGILLAVFGTFWGSIGVLVPAIMVLFFGPGKGKYFGSKK